MIIVKNTPKENVLENIDTEKTFLQGILDTIVGIENSTPSVISDIYDYIRANAVLKGIAESARKNISSRHTLLETLSFAAKNALMMLDYIEKDIKKSTVKIYDTMTLTYRQKGMFDYISSINFFSNYTSKLLDIVLTQPKTIQAMLTKADLEFFNKTVNYFTIILTRLCESETTLRKSIDILSNDVYDEEQESIISEVKGKEFVTTNLMPHELNPLYWVKYIRMKRDVSRIKANRSKIDTYAMKLQSLENKKRQTDDPVLDRQIEFWVNEIQILDAEIADIEERYA